MLSGAVPWSLRWEEEEVGGTWRKGKRKHERPWNDIRGLRPYAEGNEESVQGLDLPTAQSKVCLAPSGQGGPSEISTRNGASLDHRTTELCMCESVCVCESSKIVIIFYSSNQREEIWSINSASVPMDSTQKQSFEWVLWISNGLVTAGKCNHQIASQVEIKHVHGLSGCSGNTSWSLGSNLATQQQT